MLSIDFPLASSSMSLSRQRTFFISGSATSSTRMPQTTPLISVRFGSRAGASFVRSFRSALLTQAG